MVEITNYHSVYEETWKALFFGRARWDPKKPCTIVEVGSYEGSSARWIVDNLMHAPESRLYCIDAWTGPGMDERYERFRQVIAALPQPERIEVFRDWSQNALRELRNRNVKADVLYIDGGHDAPTVLRDLVIGFEIVKVGGLVICDDYLWNDPKFGGHQVLGRPKIAIDAFTTIYADKIAMVRFLSNYQVYFQKIAD